MKEAITAVVFSVDDIFIFVEKEFALKADIISCKYHKCNGS